MEEARFMERTNHLAENLLEIQRERGMKLTEFSRELGLPRSTLQYVMCNGNTALATLVHIANSLGSSLDELVFGGMPPMKVREKQVLVDIDNCSRLSSFQKEALVWHFDAMVTLMELAK